MQSAIPDPKKTKKLLTALKNSDDETIEGKKTKKILNERKLS